MKKEKLNRVEDAVKNGKSILSSVILEMVNELRETQEDKLPEISPNVVSFSVVKKKWDEKHCDHTHVEVDKDLWTIRCTDCGALLDPIGWMIDRAEEEDRLSYRFERMEQECDRMEEKLKKQNLCKCEHCGKMTHIEK
jgi:hypothetical protein